MSDEGNPATRHDEISKSWAGESAEAFRVAFDTASIGFAIVEVDGHFRAVNRPFCDIVGYDESELHNLTWRQLTHPDDLPGNELLSDRLVGGEIEGYHYEKRYLHKQGQIVWVKIAVSLIREGSGLPAYYVSQITDITALKEAEAALVRHARELERSNTELEQFAYIASHDLQEPLRMVSSYTLLLSQRYRNTLDERAERWIGFILSGVERMQLQIRNLLALARVRTDGNGKVPTDTGPVVARTWERLKAEHSEMRGTLVIQSLPTLPADVLQLEQLFYNLLGNAIKYRRPDVALAVIVSADRRADSGSDFWEFTVRDNGIGLDMAHAGRIFEIFHRVRRRENYEGTGIGLAICRKIVERHGGRIWVESALGTGATFFFTLPAALKS